MQTESGGQRGRRALSKGRMEAFSDGVFGVAATLLGIGIAIHPPGSASHQLLHAWPSYVAYIISFLTIGAAWLAHTALTDRLTRVDSLFLRLNLLLLMVVVFLPFPTGLIADALHERSSERVFVTLYGLTLLTIRLLGYALDAYARVEDLYSEQADGGELHLERRKVLPVLAGYVLAILIGLAWPCRGSRWSCISRLPCTQSFRSAISHALCTANTITANTQIDASEAVEIMA